MLKIDSVMEQPVIVRTRLTHGENVFDRARELMRDHVSLRDERISVFSEQGDYMYSIVWSRNMAFEMFGQTDFVDDYMEYTIESPHIDYDLLQGTEAAIFDSLEEYSYQITRMIRKHDPAYRIFFKDTNANLFFADDPYTLTVDSEDQITAILGKKPDAHVLKISSDNSFSYDKDKYDNREYSSLQVFSGFMWMTRRIHFGERNPDKTFYLIKNPVGMEGLVDVITFSLYRLLMVRRKNPEIIPVIDIGVPGDGNQFNSIGENVWTMFFEQVVDVDINEVYQSANVIIGNERLMIYNPFVAMELVNFDCASSVSENLHFNQKTQEYLDGIWGQIIPQQAGRILGVVGRGTDFNSSKVAGIVHPPMAPEKFLNKVREHMEDKGYDTIFLATEDQYIFELFMASDLKDRICFVPQDRVDYRDPNQKDKMLSDIYSGSVRDGYQETLKYLGILYILSRCDALVATTNCGAYRMPLGMNGGKYDFSLYY